MSKIKSKRHRHFSSKITFVENRKKWNPLFRRKFSSKENSLFSTKGVFDEVVFRRRISVQSNQIITVFNGLEIVLWNAGRYWVFFCGHQLLLIFTKLLFISNIFGPRFCHGKFIAMFKCVFWRQYFFCRNCLAAIVPVKREINIKNCSKNVWMLLMRALNTHENGIRLHVKEFIKYIP